MFQIGEEGIVVGAGVADGQTAGLVVAGDQDEGLVGVLLGKGHGLVHGVGQGDGVGNGGAGVVGVAGPVDLAALYHQEEAGVVVQDLNALLDVVGEGPVAVGPVVFVGKGIGISQMLVNNEDLAVGGGDGLGLRLGHDHLVAGVGSQVVEAGLVLVGAGGLQQAAAGKILEIGAHQLLADLVVVGALGLMGVKGGGGGVVQVDGGDDANLPAELRVELFGDGLIGHGGGLIHIDGAGIGLVAGGEGGGGGGGVGAEGTGVVGDGRTGHGEIHEGKGHVAVQNVVTAGVGQSAQIVGGGLELRVAHAVADEQKDILGGLGFLGLDTGQGGDGGYGR